MSGKKIFWGLFTILLGLCIVGTSYAYNPCKDQYGMFATMSVYDHEVCVCLDGYVFNHAGTRCISEKEAAEEQDEICQSDYGTHAQGAGYGHCKCKNGYVWNKDDNKCISKTERCQEDFGSNSISDGNNQCKCKAGYVWNAAGDRCISEDKNCQELYGKNSISAPDNQCQCKDGYQWNEKMTACISTSNECTKLYGKYSTAADEYGMCTCMDGYDWNKAGTECISKTSNKSCQDRYGPNSIIGDDGCTCKAGYSWNLTKTSCITSSDSTTINTQNSITDNGFSAEQNEAYAFAYANKITTMPTIEQANMKGKIIRAEIAKMFSNWVKSLGFEPNTSAKCDFTDISGVKGDLYPAIIESCQLGIMGQGITKFRPYDNITRGEVATAISRILWGNKYDGGSPYYALHLNALKYVGVLSDISDPDFKELRGNVMTMLMRASDKIDLDTLNRDLEMNPEYNNESEVINYNDKMIDTINKCANKSELLENTYDEATVQELKDMNDDLLKTCRTVVEEIGKLGGWEKDNSLRDAANEYVASLISYYEEFEKKIPYLDIENLTNIEEKELNSINAKLEELDAKSIKMQENLASVQRKFADKFGYGLSDL